MRGRREYRWRDFYDEEYFEAGTKSTYGRYGPDSAYGKSEEDSKCHYVTCLSFANKYLNVFDGRGKRALEIGCAYGYGLKVLESFGYVVCGVDISEYAISRAKDCLGSSGDIAVADAQQLPFKDSQFDLIIGLDVLEHLPSPELMVAACYRLLKPGGLLVVPTDNKIAPLAKILNSLRLRFEDESHINLRSPGEWRKTFSKHNWQSLVITCCQSIPRTRIVFNLPYLGERIRILAQR
jgi:2-polyprenyl-3-methyl-5-hydroxy-6-metoxy-1,4-benzoquinol methylase